MTTQRVQQNFSTANGIFDISGYRIFSEGDIGQAHAMAHELFDQGLPQQGHRLLGQWLDTHRGRGSNWVHLQFHMAVFELALGQWHQAHQRFIKQVLPIAATTGEALTDGPALMWRLAMSAPTQIALPWQAVAESAKASMQPNDNEFVQLHHLLAMAGAGDTGSIRSWARSTASSSILHRFGQVCEALSQSAYRQARDLLWPLVPELSQLGGSHAQNGIYRQLASWAGQQADTQALYLNAA
jgi:hypothetical protein